ncbi:MAG TPA: GNAT family N-acetyltransferase [Thermotogota bacterium]|nr:GNAT family N-acetyltransferase [Thermotogota bacterium]HPJ89758.1 GNAT family N-acetyltransferase [Thermotogota bacterium]HPR97020.1 GNAT family N-acetyltransferase [Thermotogota bacterium]
MRLVKPTYEMKEQYQVFEQEWKMNDEAIIPYSVRLLDNSYERWCDLVALYETTAPENFVSAHTFFMIDEIGKIIGAINIRHELNDFLLNYGGHIGYGIVPSERGKGYASLMLSQALPIAKQFGIRNVLLVCDKVNTASAKTIIGNGGILENEMFHNGELIQRYWINLL